MVINMHYKLGLYEKSMPNELTLKEKLEQTAKAGYDYLELSIDETDEKLQRLDFTAEEISALRDAIKETGVPIKSMCLSGHRKYPLGSREQSTQRRSLEIMQKAVTLASKLGIAIIQLAGYDVYYEENGEDTRENFSINLGKAVEMAATEGVLLGFETMETPFLDTVEKAMFWVNKINSPYLHVYPDIGNLTNAAKIYKTNEAKDLMKGAGHTVAVHLKETTPGIYREVPYGTGHVDFDTMCKTSLDMGVRMFVGEFWHTGEKNWQEILKSNNAFLRKKLGG
ncbi:MAG: L-ribulose-5-phosphate 3-epimerase [Oscillospiraceae bacterium]|nr:L-ribulose-5-phosphate 3-epimerase [Oscillospiraceae bacterium]